MLRDDVDVGRLLVGLGTNNVFMVGKKWNRQSVNIRDLRTHLTVQRKVEYIRSIQKIFLVLDPFTLIFLLTDQL